MRLEACTVVLVKPRFPENVGMVARACANMGCPEIVLVEPERWDPLKAEPTATAQAMELIYNVQIFQDLHSALAPFSHAYATTARLGGWRKNITSPERAAADISGRVATGEKIALVFGPEDRGLNNVELACCQELVSIPVEEGAKSLNIAQAVLIILYECRKALTFSETTKGCKKIFITCQEQWLLEENLKKALLGLDCFTENNQDYFFQHWRQLLNRMRLRRNEYDALMGVCRQIANRLMK